MSIHPVTAADYTIAALGVEGARTVMRALRGSSLTPKEAESVEQFAVGIAYLIGDDLPTYEPDPNREED